MTQTATDLRRDLALATQAQVRAMSSTRWISPYDFATLNAALGHCDQALRALRDAIAARDFRIPFLLISPGAEFASLEHDAEFRSLMEEIEKPATPR